MSSSPVTVVGIGADGWAGLSMRAQDVLRGAHVVCGAARQLALLPEDVDAERVAWPTGALRPAVAGLLRRYEDRPVAVLASGDPMFFGIGRTIHEVYGPVEVIPHPSSTSYACARLGWSVEDVAVVSLVGRPVDALTAALHVHRRVLVLSEGADTPQVVARLLTQRGFGATRMRVLERLGASDERVLDGIATSWGHVPGAALNVIALDVDGAQLSLVPGLPDDTYAHDGQLTKRYVRAATLAALAPRPGELLWDVGGGSGSIALEWLRAHPSCQAVSVERDAVRAGRISENAATLGIPRLRVVHAAAPEGLTDLPVPDAIFIGGGLTNPGLLDACWQALPVGGRLVANTVTIESEHVLAEFYRLHGGELIKLSVSNVAAIGGFTGWRAALPVTQLSVVKEEK